MRLVTTLFIVIGLIVMAIGTYLYRDTAAFVERAHRVEGTVVQLVERKNGLFPVVRYTDHLGREQTLYSSSGSYPPSHDVGDQVTVLIDPSDSNYPLSAKIDTFLHVWGGPVVLISLGGFFVVLASLLRYANSQSGTVSLGRNKRMPRDGAS